MMYWYPDASSSHSGESARGRTGCHLSPRRAQVRAQAAQEKLGEAPQ